jgi:6-pyruvoyltetrahydropterin/6-carboxytetrahydropterin synthase
VYSISKDFEFAAAHHLTGLPPGHKCAGVHGHNYVVRVEITAERLDGVGFVVDYGDLAPVREWIARRLDHRDLNEVLADNPTAENLAARLAREVLDRVALPEGARVAVGISETPRTWAWYRP